MLNRKKGLEYTQTFHSPYNILGRFSKSTYLIMRSIISATYSEYPHQYMNIPEYWTQLYSTVQSILLDGKMFQNWWFQNLELFPEQTANTTLEQLGRKLQKLVRNMVKMDIFIEIRQFSVENLLVRKNIGSFFWIKN